MVVAGLLSVLLLPLSALTLLRIGEKPAMSGVQDAFDPSTNRGELSNYNPSRKLPAKRYFSRVGDARFELAASAV